MYAILDADIILYKAVQGAGSQSNIDWDDDQDDDAQPADLEVAMRMVEATIEEWTELAGMDQFILCLSPRDGTNFRKVLLDSYKAQRKEKPAGYWELYEQVCQKYTVKSIRYLEADDVMGILLTSPACKGSVLVSQDKDMNTLAGLHLNPFKEGEGVREVRWDRADWFWMYQTLIGDQTDNYKGCPRIGPVKARRILESDDPADWWPAVVKAYAAAGRTVEDALMQARMARILRNEDFDRHGRTIRLWHPDPNEVIKWSLERRSNSD